VIALILHQGSSTPATCKKDRLGQDYDGTVSVTRTNIPCQAWISKVPHDTTDVHTYGYFPEADEKDAKNYCRNPDRSQKGPWCYTMDPAVVWQYCDVPLCDTTDE